MRPPDTIRPTPLSRCAGLAVAILAVAVLVLATGCSKDAKRDDKAAPGPTSAPAAPTTVPSPPQFTIIGIDSNGTQPPDEPTLMAVKAALDHWAALAVFEPLRTGQAAGDLSPVFTAPALERLADPAVRAALVDEGMPAASDEVSATVANATLFSAAGPDGAVAVVAAHLDFRVHAVGPGIDVDISRVGDMVLVPDVDSWKIESFGIHTARDSRGG